MPSNMLKPALARGGCCALSGANDAQRNIASTSRRIRLSSDDSRSCTSEKPNVEDTVAILRGLKERYESHHKVRIKDSAIVAAATLSHRYISDRFLPDKAIDLVDEAAAALAIQIGSVPTEN